MGINIEGIGRGLTEVLFSNVLGGDEQTVKSLKQVDRCPAESRIRYIPNTYQKPYHMRRLVFTA